MQRRAFLKGLAGAGFAAAAAPAAATTALAAPILDGGTSDTELCTLLDLSRCVGCGACADACQESNAYKFPEPEKPFPEMFPPRVKAEDFSENRDDTSRLTPYAWLTVQTADVTYNGQDYTVNIPRRCMHCQNAPCADLCPWGAARREANGIVRIDSEVCLGGAKCRSVCPWHIPQRQTGVGLYRRILPKFAGNGVMYKCDRCYDRIAQGELPACIEVCPEGVQTIGPRNEIVAKAKQLAKDMNGFIYGMDENGGTNTIYVSPVPFDLLNKAIPKGPGQPHLAPVANAMAIEDRLGWAVLAAPVAGVMGGLLKAGSRMAKLAKEDDDNA